MSKLRLIYDYLSYRKKSVNEHGVHSPFVFDLLLSTVYNFRDFYSYKKIEALRGQLLQSEELITCVDLGAGSLVQNKKTKSVKLLAKTAAKPPKYSKLLFRLVNYFQPKTVVELGTSLGISTAYMASANSKTKVLTIEGCKDIAAIADQNLKKLKINNVEQVVGNFDDVLPLILDKVEKLDFVFFDGNHRKEPTINYLELCLTKSHENSVFVFDDIHWSQEMKEAWQVIKNNNRVTVTIDLFYMGIVFFRKEQTKQHFIITY